VRAGHPQPVRPAARPSAEGRVTFSTDGRRLAPPAQNPLPGRSSAPCGVPGRRATPGLLSRPERCNAVLCVP
jgi:hypothetical protein